MFNLPALTPEAIIDRRAADGNGAAVVLRSLRRARGVGRLRALRGVAHQDREALVAQTLLAGDRVGRQVERRRRLQLEVAEAVLAAHQRRAVRPDVLMDVRR